MNSHPHMYYTQVETQDGVRTPFPVSRHVLKVRPLHRGSTSMRRFSLFEQSASVFLTLALVVSSFSLSYGSLENTASYFRDDESSRDNAFAAGLLGFGLNPGEVTVPIKIGERIFISPLFTPDDDTFPIQYRVRAEVMGEDSPLCTLLEAYGTTSPYLYSGALKNLVTEPATTTGRGNFMVYLPDAPNVPNGAECTVAIVYKGWYAEAPEGTGYTDEERDTFTFVLDNPTPEAATESAATETPVEPPVAPKDGYVEISESEPAPTETETFPEETPSEQLPPEALPEEASPAETPTPEALTEQEDPPAPEETPAPDLSEEPPADEAQMPEESPTPPPQEPAPSESSPPPPAEPATTE
jgi:hypothetical protein